MTTILPALLFSLAIPVKPAHPPQKAAVAVPACLGAEPPAGFAFPLPGLEEFVPADRLDPSATKIDCTQSPASAAQRFGERLQQALKDAWPKASAAVLATSEHVNLPSFHPPLVKFCFVGAGVGEEKSVACGEVVYSVTEGTIELKVDGRTAVTAAQNAGSRR